ncbi:Uncharacterised protein [Staphylococcus gallinarum]|uniref:Uncharacterized protein n=1 Tax=Staphylococcus gallinarum TaxID=1293 RepID=A0A380FAW5_STAGA|nr:Uncharacterised protein [Staphylococcus gallinarum]
MLIRTTQHKQKTEKDEITQVSKPADTTTTKSDDKDDANKAATTTTSDSTNDTSKQVTTNDSTATRDEKVEHSVETDKEATISDDNKETTQTYTSQATHSEPKKNEKVSSLDYSIYKIQRLDYNGATLTIRVAIFLLTPFDLYPIHSSSYATF